MATADFDLSARIWTADELRRLPADQRDAILAAAAAKAKNDYLCDASLTDFAAFGPEDLHGESAGASAG